MKYFSNLPIVEYSNNYVRNILTRIKFADEFKDDAQTYYPYVQEEAQSLRYENLAFDYYDDPDDVWVIHLFNEVVDPYYDVTLSQEDFDNYLTKKYGSVRNAHQKIVFYRNNYDQDDTVLDQNGYNALTTNVKRYWKPNVTFEGKIIGYDRIPLSTTITTNKIISIDYSLVSNNTFSVGERVTQGESSGFVTFSNTSVINLQHIIGSFSNTSYISGEDSRANAEVTSVKMVYDAFDDENFVNTMSSEEEVYYSPVTAFDHETELNEQKKRINLLSKELLPVVHTRFREIMENVE